MLLVDPGIVLAWLETVSGPAVWALRGGGTVLRALAAARSAMKVVAVASVTGGGRRAGRCCLRAWDGGS